MRAVRTVCLSALIAAAPALAAKPKPQPGPPPASLPDGGVVKQGVDLWRSGDATRAVGLWQGPADAGDADAQFNLGQAYKLGKGVPAVDLRQAEGWYRRAAVQGHRQAQDMLGLVMFQNGDRQGAAPWLRQSAERGDPRASYLYGTMLFNGDQVPKDWPTAYAYMTRAAAAGLPQAQASLGQMDTFIPTAQRQQGLALARDMAKRTPGTGPAPTVTAAAPPPPGAIARTELPPSSVRSGDAPPAPPRPVTVPPRPTPAPARPAPRPAPEPAAPASLAGAGGWRVQLGAFADAGAAQRAWGSVAGRLGGLRPTYTKVGQVTRLQAGPLPSRAAAAKACQIATAAGRDCFPVAP